MSVTLTYGALILELPSPIFNNTQNLNLDRVNRQSRGLDAIVYRDSIWPRSEILSYVFNVSRCQYSLINSLKIFIRQSLGQIITLLDYEGVLWTGIINNPSLNLSQPERDTYTFNLEFEGTNEVY